VKVIKLLVALAAPSLGCACNLSAQATKPIAVPSRATTPKTDSVLGPKRAQLLGVFDEVGPMDSVEVIDLVGDKMTRTPKNGIVPLGWQGRLNDNSAIQVRKIGYTDTILVIGPKDTADITLVLRRIATALPTVMTIAKVRSGFDTRVRAGFGRFLTPEELKNPKYDNMSVGDAIRTLGTNASHRGVRPCGSKVLVDGSEVRGEFLRFLSDDPIRRFEAVEFYPSDLRTPEEFRRGTGESCGVMVLWTRVPKG
jgi:hypothetical protein